MNISVVPPLMKKTFLKMPLLIERNLVSRDRNRVGSVGLGLRATDSSPCSQTRRHSQTWPFSPEISLDSPSLPDCWTVGEPGATFCRGWGGPGGCPAPALPFLQLGHMPKLLAVLLSLSCQFSDFSNLGFIMSLLRVFSWEVIFQFYIYFECLS